MPSSFRFNFLWVVIAFNLSLQVVLSAEEFTLKDKATGKIQATFSATTGRLTVGAYRYSLIPKSRDTAFILAGDEKGVAKSYGPFAFSNGLECVIGGVTYVIEKESVKANGAVEFILKEDKSGTYYGPFEFRDGVKISIDDVSALVSTTNSTTFSIITSSRGIKSQSAPYALTNHSPVRIGAKEMYVLVDDEARQTLALEKAFRQASVKGLESGKILSILNDAIKANPKADGLDKAIALRDKRAKEQDFERSQTAKGLVRYQDQWVTPTERDDLSEKARQTSALARIVNQASVNSIPSVQKIADLDEAIRTNPKAERLDQAITLRDKYAKTLKFEEEQIAKGLVKVEGKWLTKEQVYQRFREIFRRLVVSCATAQGQFNAENKIVREATDDAVNSKAIDPAFAYQSYRTAVNHFETQKALGEQVNELGAIILEYRLKHPTASEALLKEMSSDSSLSKGVREYVDHLLKEP